jgi:hypothetical protein
MLSASRDDVMRSERVDTVKMFPRAPDTSNARTVKDNVDVMASVSDCDRIAQVTSYSFYAKLIKLRVVSSRKAANTIATSHELFSDVLAKKPAWACYKGEQVCVSRLAIT